MYAFSVFHVFVYGSKLKVIGFFSVPILSDALGIIEDETAFFVTPTYTRFLTVTAILTEFSTGINLDVSAVSVVPEVPSDVPEVPDVSPSAA